MKFRRDHMAHACETARRLANNSEYHERPSMSSPLLTLVLVAVLIALVFMHRR